MVETKKKSKQQSQQIKHEKKTIIPLAASSESEASDF
jgi:hypothetical protein